MEVCAHRAIGHSGDGLRLQLAAQAKVRNLQHDSAKVTTGAECAAASPSTTPTEPCWTRSLCNTSPVSATSRVHGAWHLGCEAGGLALVRRQHHIGAAQVAVHHVAAVQVGHSRRHLGGDRQHHGCVGARLCSRGRTTVSACRCAEEPAVYPRLQAQNKDFSTRQAADRRGVSGPRCCWRLAAAVLPLLPPWALGC